MTNIYIIEQTLTDGSKVYNVSLAPDAEFSCVTENDAIELAKTIDRLAMDAQFNEGADYIQRAA
jgi:hypothetical protein